MAGRVAGVKGQSVPAAPTQGPTSKVWKAGAAAALGAAVLNMILLIAAKAAEVQFLVPDLQGRIVEIGIGQVALLSVFPLLAGTAAAAGVRRLSVDLRWVQGVAVVLTLLSLLSPLALDSPASTKLVLSAMHVVAGIAFVAAIERDRQTGFS